MRLVRIFLMIAQAAFAPLLAAQQPGITRYDLDQGLPQSMVRHVLQDADGFIWLGTGDGLARLDGSRFVVFKHDPRDGTSLSHNAIWGLAEADAHHLWVGTRTGLDRLDRRTGRFEHVNTGAGVDGCWKPVRITADEAIFYSSLSRDLLRVTVGRASRQPTHRGDSYCLQLSGEGILAMVTSADSLIAIPLDGGSERVSIMQVEPEEKSSAMIDVGSNTLLLTHRNGFLVRPDGSTAEIPRPLRERLRAVTGDKHAARDPQGRLWVGISGVGVLVLRDDLSIERTYPLLEEGQGPLVITTIAFDRQGNTWVGTDGKGVFKISPQRIKFGRCAPGMGLPWEPPSWFVRGFAQWDDHRVLVAFHLGGLALFDERDGSLAPIVLPGMDESTICDRLFNDPRGVIWMHCGGLVYTVEPDDDRPLPRPMDDLPQALFRDRDGSALLMRGSTVTRYERTGGEWRATTSPSPLPDTVAMLAERIVVDPHGQWWVSSVVLPISVWSGGSHLSFHGEAPHERTVMTGLFPLNDGTAWMTTNDGLFHWSLDDRRLLDHFTIHEGLPDQYLYMMLPDDERSWWISSNNGLSRFDPRQGQSRNYTRVHGLQSREFNSNAAMRSASGMLYFGGVHGFNFFRPQDVIDDPDTALVRIVGAIVGHAAVDPGNGLTLPYGRNDVRIDLAVLEFTAPEDNRYAYQLEGYDTTWTWRSASQPVEFANLPDGGFRLTVKGVNADGLESAPRELLKITVPLPFWASAWAVVLGSVMLAVLAGLLVYIIYRRRVRRRMELAELEMQELRLRTRLAQDLHDDVGSGLAQIAALTRLSSASSAIVTDPGERVRKVGAISQELMENLRDVVWMNQPGNSDLATVLLRIRSHINDLFDGSDTAVDFRFPEPLPERPISDRFKRHLFLVAKEAAHNAYKYARAGRITVTFTADEGNFHFSLADDGTGTPSPSTGGGHGLRNMRARAAEIGCTFTFAQRKGVGSVVHLTCPTSALDQ